MLKKIQITLAVWLLLTTIIPFSFSKPASAIATGCTSKRPTAITGTIKGYGGDYHNWSVKVLIGIDLLNSSKKKVYRDGTPKKVPGYSYTDTVNPSLSPPGSASVLDQSFGKRLSEGNGVLCVSSKVKTVWFELYPKDDSGQTIYSYHGGAADHNMKVKSGVTNNYVLRLPTAYSHGGKTGDVNGYVKYKNKAINNSNLKFRAFPYLAGSACGVQGFSASATTLVNGGSKNYYKIINLASGQCGKSKQRYRITATCTNKCGAPKRTILKYVYVGKGAKPRVDFKF